MIALVVVILGAVLLHRTRFGRYTYAIGSNEEAARRVGVRVDRHLIMVYALSGLLAGFAGVLLSLAQFGTTTIAGQSQTNLNVIAAVVIGGTSLFGGVGIDLRHRRRPVHPGRAAERVRDRRRAAVLAAGRRRRGAHRRRLRRPASAGPRRLSGAEPRSRLRSRSQRKALVRGARRTKHESHIKRNLAVPSAAAVLAAAAALAACGAADGRRRSDGGGTTSYAIAFVQGVAGDEFYITMECGIEEEAEKLGATVDAQGPQKFDPTLQKPIVDSVVATKPDAILIAPTDVSAMQAPLEAAADAGHQGRAGRHHGRRPVVRGLARSPPTTRAAARRRSTRSSSWHRTAARSWSSRSTRASPPPTPGSRASRTPSPPTRRSQYLGVQYSHNDPATAAQLVTAALQKDPDIVGIFATNLFSAEGTATGIRQAGKQDQVKVVGFDAGPDQIKALKDGTVQALIAQQPGDDRRGRRGSRRWPRWTASRPSQKIQTGFTIITKDNVDGDAKDAVYKSSC